MDENIGDMIFFFLVSMRDLVLALLYANPNPRFFSINWHSICMSSYKLHQIMRSKCLIECRYCVNHTILLLRSFGKNNEESSLGLLSIGAVIFALILLTRGQLMEQMYACSYDGPIASSSREETGENVSHG